MMNSRKSKLPLLPIVFLSISIACSGLQTAPVKSFQLDERHTSRKEAALSQPFVIDPSIIRTYSRSSMFSYTAPVNWVVKNTEYGVSLYSPTSIIFSASLVPTGYRLSTSSFIELASNTENTQYGMSGIYEEVYRHEDRPNRSMLVEKTYIQAGVKRLVSTIYRQVDETMYMVEMEGNRVDIMANPEYAKFFLAFNDSIQDQQTDDAKFRAFARSWEFTDDSNRLSIEVPIGWRAEKSQPQDGLTVTQFLSPDGNAVIDNVFLNNGKKVDLGSAADLALKLIRTSYAKNADDIKVITEVILGDGNSEKITWVSRMGGYGGVAYFEIRNNNTQAVVLSAAWNRLFEDIYSPVMDQAISSYKLNPAVE